MSLAELALVEEIGVEDARCAFDTVVKSKERRWYMHHAQVAIPVGSEAGEVKHQEKGIRNRYALDPVLDDKL